MPIQFSSFSELNKLRIDPYEHPPTELTSFGWMFLSPRKPQAFKFFETQLLKVEIGHNFVDVSRRIAESTTSIIVAIIVQRFDKNRKCIDRANDMRRIFRNLSDEIREEHVDGYQTERIILTPRDDYCFAAINILVHIRTKCLLDPIPEFLFEIGSKKKGFSYLECEEGGSVRVFKKTLSDEFQYFRNLFNGKKRQTYRLKNVQIADLIELIYYLPPYQRGIQNGITYGALFRLSEIFCCLKLAEICQEYIDKLRSYAPLSASFIAFEGGVDDESKMYREMKQTDYENMKAVLRKEHVFREYYNTPTYRRRRRRRLPSISEEEEDSILQDIVRAR